MKSQRLLTRQEIINIWMKQKDEMKSRFCCPDCRDILMAGIDNDYLFCPNRMCNNNTRYTLEGFKKSC